MHQRRDRIPVVVRLVLNRQDQVEEGHPFTREQRFHYLPTNSTLSLPSIMSGVTR